MLNQPHRRAIADSPTAGEPSCHYDDITASAVPSVPKLYRRLGYTSAERGTPSLREHRTAQRIAAALRPPGFEVTEQIGGTGVVGLLRNGDGPVLEETGLPYASTVRAAGQDGDDVPVMHACGHDMHATCLLGAAALLARAPGTWSGTSAQVVLYGQGGHGSRPEAAVDPVLMAASIVTRLQGIVARLVPPAEVAVVTVGRLQAGTKDNIIPDTAELGINVRTYSSSTRDLVRAAVERIITAEATASAAPRPPLITWDISTPLLVSDPAATETTVAAFTGYFGSQRLMPMPLVTASEDVGVFGEVAARTWLHPGR
jgi:metal-dependent amidase/aminoacylase/carboxypeptidase family protein